MPARRMAITGRNGSPAAYSLAPDLGSTGPIVSMVTSITISTCAGATAEASPRAVRLVGNTAESSTVRRCITRAAAKPRVAGIADTSKAVLFQAFGEHAREKVSILSREYQRWTNLDYVVTRTVGTGENPAMAQPIHRLRSRVAVPQFDPQK